MAMCNYASHTTCVYASIYSPSTWCVYALFIHRTCGSPSTHVIMHTFSIICVRVHLKSWAHVLRYAYVSTYSHIRAYTYVYTWVRHVYTRVRTYVCIHYVYIYLATCTYIYIYVCIYIYTYVYICIYTYM